MSKRQLARAASLLFLVLCACHANAITLIGSSSATGTNPLSINVPAGTVAGDVIITAVVVEGGSNNIITPPAGWVLIREDSSAANADLHQALYYHVATNAEPAAYNWTFGACNNCFGSALTYRGADNTDPIDASSGNAAFNTSNLTALSVNTTASNDELVAVYAIGDGSLNKLNALTPPAGMTKRVEQRSNGSKGVVQAVIDGTFAGPGAAGNRVATTNNMVAAAISQLVALKPSALDHFVITLPDGSPIPQATAGQSFSIRISAVDAGGNLVTGFSGTVDVTSNGMLTQGGGTTPGFSSGVLDNYSIVVTNTGTFTLTATKTGSTVTGSSNTFPVTAGPFAKLQVLVQGETAAPGSTAGKTGAPVSPEAGASFTVTVNAVDAYWNIVATVSDVVSLSASDGSASLPPDAALINGTHTFTVALNTAGGQTVTASDLSDGTVADGVSSLIDVIAIAAGFNAFDTSTAFGATTGPLTTKVAGQAFAVDIIAIKNGAVDDNYNKLVTVTLIVSNSSTPVPSGCPAGWLARQSKPVTFPHTVPNRPRLTFTENNAWRQARFEISDGKTTSCSTNTFAIRPAGLGQVAVQDLDRTSPGTTNVLNVTTASGSPIHNAGRPFRVTATGLNAVNAVTSNYDGSPEPTALALILPTAAECASCVPGAFSTGGWTASGGTVVTTSATYSEAGSFSMQLVDQHFADIDIDDSSAAQRYIYSNTFNVGRFVPDHFAVVRNTPSFATGCVAGQFTYVGEAFGFDIAPVITVTAQNAANATTRNYTASLFRLTNASLTGRSYTDSGAPPDAGLDTAGLPTTADPAIVDNGNGTGTLTFSAGAGLDYFHAAPVAPFNSLIDLSINVRDLDAVTVDTIDGVAAGNPVAFNGIAFDNGNQMRYGRVFINSAVGSEFLDLPMRMVAQYYKDGNSGFVVNTADSCTSVTDVALSNFQPYTGSLFTAGDTTETFIQLAATTTPGDFNLSLSAPGAGHQGTVDVTADVPMWLQFDWNGDGAYDDNPTSRAAFGIYKGNPHRVYQREVVGSP